MTNPVKNKVGVTVGLSLWAGAAVASAAGVVALAAGTTRPAGPPAAASAPATATPAAATAALTVRVTDVRNAKGTVNVGLWRTPDGFPDDQNTAVFAVRLPAGAAEFSVRGLPAGDYALAAYHDENGNGVLDRAPVGLPLEGYATSNDVRHPSAPPKFDECRVAVPATGAAVTARMQY